MPQKYQPFNEVDVAAIKLAPEVRRMIRIRYREQLKKWAPQLVQSHAPPATKGLMVLLTDIWEQKDRAKPLKQAKRPRRRRSRWRKGGYGVYDLRLLKFGEWIRREVTV